MHSEPFRRCLYYSLRKGAGGVICHVSGPIGPLSVTEFCEALSFVLDALFWRLLCFEYGFTVG
jgi:hypothetical protein